ncbi:YagK/YfjJ domain-containing protein [Luteimonas cellulosilyticus]
MLRSKGPLWTIVQERGRCYVDETRLGSQFFLCTKADFAEIDRRFKNHRCSPLYAVFRRYARRLWSGEDRVSLRAVDSFNRAVEKIRALGRGPAVKKRLDNLRRCERSSAKSAVELLQGLRNRYSKVLAIRLDLEYYSLYSARERLLPQSITLREAQAHRDAFLKYLRSGPFSEHLIGYIWKMEFGCEKGFHFHFAIFLDGQRVRQDIVIADTLGVRWKNVITRRKGIFFNCNKRKETYVRCGIGTLDRSNDQMWGHLHEAVRYMTKVDHLLRFQTLGRVRAFAVGRRQKIRRISDVG